MIWHRQMMSWTPVAHDNMSFVYTYLYLFLLFIYLFFINNLLLLFIYLFFVILFLIYFLFHFKILWWLEKCFLPCTCKNFWFHAIKYAKHTSQWLNWNHVMCNMKQENSVRPKIRFNDNCFRLMTITTTLLILRRNHENHFNPFGIITPVLGFTCF